MAHSTMVIETVFTEGVAHLSFLIGYTVESYVLTPVILGDDSEGVGNGT
jgi:hypothetical protein